MFDTLCTIEPTPDLGIKGNFRDVPILPKTVRFLLRVPQMERVSENDVSRGRGATVFVTKIAGLNESRASGYK